MMPVTLASLASSERWVAWRNEIRSNKSTKVPFSPRTGRKAKANDPSDWARRSEAEAWARTHVDGSGGIGLQLGHVQGEQHSLGGVDLDTCRDQANGVIAPWALEVITRLGSYAEISPSGSGVKIFFLYANSDLSVLRAVMGTDHGKQFKCGMGEHLPAIELHLSNRYFAVTDQHVGDTPIELHLVELDTLLWLLTQAGPALRGNGACQSNPDRQASAKETRAEARPAVHSGSLAQEASATVLAQSQRAVWRMPKLAARWNGSTKDLRDTSRSGMDMSLTVLLKRAGFSFEDTKALLLHWQFGAGPEHASDERYFRRMWDRADPLSDGDSRDHERQNAASASRQMDGGLQSDEKPLWLRIGSDNEIASRVATDLQERFGHIVYCGQFWSYGATQWEPIPEDTLWLMASRYDGALFETVGGPPSRVKLNKSRIESILACMRPGLTSREFFDSSAIGINCVSGFIRFDDQGEPTLETHNPDHRCRHTLPGCWPKAITTEQWKTSLFEQLLEGCFKEDVDKRAKVDLLAEVAGIAALGLATKITNPKALVLKGELAENGKSQILEVLRSLLPKSAVASISPARFDDRTFTCHLHGKLLNAPDELASADAIASETFKQIITGEPLTVRDVYKSAFDFRPVAQHVYATNNLPSFKGGMDRGVRRRLMVLSFNRVIPVAERIDHIGLKIGSQEADLLLDWAVRGASRVIANQAFTEPPSSTDALRDWTLSSDPVLSWLESEAVSFSVEPCPSETRVSHAYKHFRQWATEEGYSQDKLPAVNGFSQRVLAAAGDKGVRKKRTSQGGVFVGLRCAGLGPTHYGDNWR